MKPSNSERSTHRSPRDCARADTVDFDNEYVNQGGKIALLGECTDCERKFERIWLYSHDQCYSPEHEEVAISPQPH